MRCSFRHAHCIQHVPHTRTLQVEELRREIEILSQNHEREVDRKDAIVQVCVYVCVCVCVLYAAVCCKDTIVCCNETWHQHQQCTCSANTGSSGV